VLLDKIVARFGPDLAGRTFAVWGLAFKPNTDDMREAPSRVLIEGLIARGATVNAFDPVAMHEAQRAFGPFEGLHYADRAMAAVAGADALVIATEWKEFRSPDFAAVKAALREPVVFDGRNMYAPEFVEAAGLEYHAIGRLTAAVRKSLAQP
jgi:UDPglucose 6-dehydrogenase